MSVYVAHYHTVPL